MQTKTQTWRDKDRHENTGGHRQQVDRQDKEQNRPTGPTVQAYRKTDYWTPTDKQTGKYKDRHTHRQKKAKTDNRQDTKTNRQQIKGHRETGRQKQTDMRIQGQTDTDKGTKRQKKQTKTKQHGQKHGYRNVE